MPLPKLALALTIIEKEQGPWTIRDMCSHMEVKEQRAVLHGGICCFIAAALMMLLMLMLMLSKLYVYNMVVHLSTRWYSPLEDANERHPMHVVEGDDQSL